ncbi:MAG TPA: FAD-dependent oxidoreductase [Asticcacaulis sp.]|nr:FAD-dependent oxidoreductase [Asticcacaulis sp.]
MKSFVIGAGVMGLNIALELQARGYEVTLIEARQGGFDGASYGNAGHIATEQVEPLASWATITSAPQRLFPRGALDLPLSGLGAWLPFSLRMMQAAAPQRFARGKATLSALLAKAMPAWRRRVADLGAPDLLREDGHSIVWETPQSAEIGLARWIRADTAGAVVRPLTADELAHLQTLTTRQFFGGVRFDGTGQIADNARLLNAMKASFIARGGVWLAESVVSLHDAEGGAGIRLSGGENLRADTVIVSAGAGSKPLLQALGHTVPLIAERGYHIQSAKHGWPCGLPPVVFEDRSLIVTGFESGLRAASFVEFNRPDAPPDPRKWAKLRQHVRELGLPFGEADAEWMGARPTLPDYLPAIGRSTRAKHVYYAFGHQHLGLTLGAVTGDLVADMVATDAAPENFNIERFR